MYTDTSYHVTIGEMLFDILDGDFVHLLEIPKHLRKVLVFLQDRLELLFLGQAPIQ